MAGSHSLHQKLFVVLQEAEKAKHETVAELVNQLKRRKPINFMYSFKSKDGEGRVEKVSETSIKRAVKVCVDLGFLAAGNCRLTSKGRSAVRSETYDDVLQKVVKHYMGEHGVDMGQLARVVGDELLGGKEFDFPTKDAIWKALVASEITEMEWSRFSLCLTLLDDCNAIRTFQRKLYIPT